MNFDQEIESLRQAIAQTSCKICPAALWCGGKPCSSEAGIFMAHAFSELKDWTLDFPAWALHPKVLWAFDADESSARSLLKGLN